MLFTGVTRRTEGVNNCKYIKVLSQIIKFTVKQEFTQKVERMRFSCPIIQGVPKKYCAIGKPQERAL